MTAKRGPDDKPFDFNLDGYIKSLDLTPWRFQLVDRRWEMAHFDSLDSKEAQEAMEAGDDRALIALAMGPDQFAEFDGIGLIIGGQRELVRRYLKHCGVDVGKLPGSTSS